MVVLELLLVLLVLVLVVLELVLVLLVLVLTVLVLLIVLLVFVFVELVLLLVLLVLVLVVWELVLALLVLVLVVLVLLQVLLVLVLVLVLVLLCARCAGWYPSCRMAVENATPQSIKLSVGVGVCLPSLCLFDCMHVILHPLRISTWDQQLSSDYLPQPSHYCSAAFNHVHDQLHLGHRPPIYALQVYVG